MNLISTILFYLMDWIGIILYFPQQTAVKSDFKYIW